MAEIAKEVNGGDARDLHSLLSSPARDFLIRKNGEQVINIVSLFSQLISTCIDSLDYASQSVVFFWLVDGFSLGRVLWSELQLEF